MQGMDEPQPAIVHIPVEHTVRQYSELYSSKNKKKINFDPPPSLEGKHLRTFLNAGFENQWLSIFETLQTVGITLSATIQSLKTKKKKNQKQ